MSKIPISLKGEFDISDEIIVGIDLGTTNSLIAITENGRPKILRIDDENLVPSVVYINGNGTPTIGRFAEDEISQFPERVIYSIKRLLGKAYSDVKTSNTGLAYTLIDVDEESMVKVQIGDSFFSPIDLSALILRKLKTDGERALGKPISKAVITVPAYFNDIQRQATRDAGKIAGLDVLRIVNEPTAASLAYGIGLNPEISKNVAIYDLGGGTFDISILSIEEGIFEVLSTHGDTFLGGDDFDQEIVNHWLKNHPQLKDNGHTHMLRTVAINAKKILSDGNLYEAEIDEIEVKISRDEFESSIGHIIDRTIDSCKQALADANLSLADLDDLVLVGGSTRIPLVRKAVEDYFGIKPHTDLNPSEVVALGAAIQADILAGNNKDFLLLDVTPLTLGIETIGGLMDVIIPRNNKVPSSQARNYTTSVDGQKHLRISVFQGERDMVTDNRKIGEFTLSDIPPMPAGIPKIEVQFIIDADGILQVKARELRSGEEAHIKINAQYGISEEEMSRMLLDSIGNAEADMKRRALEEARVEAKTVILATQKFIRQNVNHLNKVEIQTLESYASRLKELIESDNKDAIHNLMQELNTFSSPLAERAMNTAIKQAITGKRME